MPSSKEILFFFDAQALAGRDVAGIQALCRQGCPLACRADMWEAALCGVEESNSYADRFDQVCLWN